MEEKKVTNLWLGSELGILKAVNLVNKLARNHFDKESYGKELEILSMCWDEKQSSKLYTGHANGIVRTFDVETGLYTMDKYQFPKQEDAADRLVKVCKTSESFATCTRMGKFAIWQTDNEGIEVKTSFDVGRDVCDMVNHENDANMFAIGGKENPLKIYDVENANKPIFTAKNVPHDWLQLRVPVWVTGIKFLRNSEKIVTCTGTGKVRLYDPSSPQRRPCMDIEFDEYPLTAITVTNDNQVIVGNSRGSMGLFDLRKKALVHAFKGFAGSIRGLHCHPDLNYVASCGVDRFLRVHHIKTGKLEHKVYLKSRLNCVLFTDVNFVEHSKKYEEKLEEERKRRLAELEEDSDEDTDDDDVWRNIHDVDDEVKDSSSQIKEKVIKGKRKKKRPRKRVKD